VVKYRRVAKLVACEAKSAPILVRIQQKKSKTTEGVANTLQQKNVGIYTIKENTVALLIQEVNTRKVGDRLIYCNYIITQISHCAGWKIYPESLHGFSAHHNTIEYPAFTLIELYHMLTLNSLQSILDTTGTTVHCWCPLTTD
jgi:hypothetical protein